MTILAPEIDVPHARYTLGRLLEAFRNGDYPYQNYSLPQDLLPEDIRTNPAICACLLFYSCHYMRGTIKSGYAMKRMIKLYRARPDFFNPHVAATLSHAEVMSILKWMLPYKAEEIARFWIENSRRLVEHWKGNPIRIFDDVHTPEDLYRFIANKETTKDVAASEHPREQGFLGFQKKMSSMLAYFFTSCDLIDAKKVAPPVDFHHVRIFVATRMLKVPETWTRARYEVLQPYIIAFFEEYIRETGVTMREVGDAVWLLSILLCGRTPSNQTRDGELIIVDWRKESSKKIHAATCGACPLEKHCCFAVQANVYYQQGYFELNQERKKPLLTEPLPFTLPHFVPKIKPNGHGKPKVEKRTSPTLFGQLSKTEKPERSFK